MFCEKGVLKNFENSQENTCAKPSLIFYKEAGGACNFIKKEILVQVLACECCEIFENTFFYRTPPVAASNDRRYKNSISDKKSITQNYNCINNYFSHNASYIITIINM